MFITSKLQTSKYGGAIVLAQNLRGYNALIDKQRGFPLPERFLSRSYDELLRNFREGYFFCH